MPTGIAARPQARSTALTGASQHCREYDGVQKSKIGYCSASQSTHPRITMTVPCKVKRADADRYTTRAGVPRALHAKPWDTWIPMRHPTRSFVCLWGSWARKPLAVLDVLCLLPYWIDLISTMVAPETAKASGTNFIRTLRLLRVPQRLCAPPRAHRAGGRLRRCVAVLTAPTDGSRLTAQAACLLGGRRHSALYVSMPRFMPRFVSLSGVLAAPARA